MERMEFSTGADPRTLAERIPRVGGSSSLGTRVASGCFLMAALMLIGGFADPRYRDGLYYLLATTCLSFLPIVFLRPRGSDPLTFILLTPTVLFSIEQLTMRLGYYNIFFYFDRDDWPFGLTEDSVRRAAALVLLGHTMLWVGYLAPVSRSAAQWVTRQLRPYLADDRPTPHMTRVMAVFLSGVAVRMFMVVNGTGGYFGDPSLRGEAQSYIQWLIMLASLATLSLMVAVFAEVRSQRPRWGLVIAALAVELATVLLEGFKAPIGYRILYVGIIFAMVRKKFPPWILPMAFLGVWIVYPLVESARSATGHGRLETGNITSILDAMQEGAVQHYGSGQAEYSTSERIFRTSAQLEPLAMVVQYVDTTGTCWYGSDYLYPVISFIPRAIWPSKPSAHHGMWLTNEVYGLEGTSSQTTTVPGNFYLNYGTTGIVIGFLLWGALGRFVREVIRESRSARVVPLIPFLIHFLGMPFPDLGPHLAGLIQTTIIFSLVLRFLSPVAVNASAIQAADV